MSEQQRGGYDFLKIYTRLSLVAFDAVMAAAKRHGMRVVGHLPEAVPLAHAVNAGMESLEHPLSFLPALQSDDSPFIGKPLAREMFDHVDIAKIPAMAAQVQLAGAWTCPTLVVREKASLAGAFEEQMRRSEMQYLPPAVPAYWRGLSEEYQLTGGDANLYRRTLGVQRSIVAGLHAVGARILLGTDSNMPLVAWGFAIHDELRLLVEAGLSPYEAIRAGTSDAAEFLRASNEFGRVASGLRADLILLEADPFANVANVARRAGVMLRGRWLAEPELLSMLRDSIATAAPSATMAVPHRTGFGEAVSSDGSGS